MTALCFPGQGSQRVGMLELYSQHPQVAAAVATASAALGIDLEQISNDDDAINATVNTQPLLLAVGVGVYQAWLAAGGEQPKLVAGHSLGEFSALVAAGSLSLEQGVQLVRLRAQAMQDAVAEGSGAMCAVLGLDATQVSEVCQQIEQAWVANINAPGQIVIAGTADAVVQAAEKCKQAGAKRAVNLPVSVPSHCPLMQPAADELAQSLNDIDLAQPTIDLIHNTTCTPASDVASLKENLVAQLTQPVNWIGCVEKLAATAKVFECGPSKVLFNLNRRIIAAEHCASLDCSEAITTALA